MLSREYVFTYMLKLRIACVKIAYTVRKKLQQILSYLYTSLYVGVVDAGKHFKQDAKYSDPLVLWPMGSWHGIPAGTSNGAYGKQACVHMLYTVPSLRVSLRARAVGGGGDHIIGADTWRGGGGGGAGVHPIK